MDYGGLAQYLKKSQDDEDPFIPPTYINKVNDKAEYEKDIVETTGTFLTQHAGVNTAKRLLKKSNILSSEERDDLLDSLSKGEGKEGLLNLSKRLTGRGMKKMGSKLKDLSDRFVGKSEGAEDAAVRAASGVQETNLDAATDVLKARKAATVDTYDQLDDAATDRILDKWTSLDKSNMSQSDQFDARENLVNDEAERAGLRGGDVADDGGGSAAQDMVDSLRQKASSAGDEVTAAVKKGLGRFGKMADDAESAGSDIGKAIRTAGEVDAAGGGPEDPLGDVAALVVGVGSLIGGLFKKTHKEEWAVPKVAQTYESYAVQKGA